MGWETRHGRAYYIRSVRCGSRVRHIYLGNGREAELADALVEKRKADRQARAKARMEFSGRWNAAVERLRRLAAELEMLLTAALTVDGFHRHDRGQWRRKRRLGRMAIHIDPPEGLDQETFNQFVQVADQVRAGDADARAELKRILEDHPQIYRHCGDLAGLARTAWIDLATLDDAATAMSVARHLDEMEDELVRPNATRLEKLLAKRVVISDLMASTADLLASSGTAGTSGAIRREAMLRQRSASGMLLAAARTLATCQKLLKPPPSPLEMLRPQAEREPCQRTSRSKGGRFTRRGSPSPEAVLN
jgi:hypothetical protein